MGVQWRRAAEAAALGAAEMGALRDWIEEIHSKEAADRFSSSLPPVAVTVRNRTSNPDSWVLPGRTTIGR